MLEWLPKQISVDPWTSDTYDILYGVFCRDIRDYPLKYNHKDVWIFKNKDGGKEIIFWHLTTRNAKPIKIPRRKQKFYPKDQIYVSEERLPDLRRCERLTWVKPLIEHSSDPEILAWDYEEGDGTIKTYVWLKNYNFVVIMKCYPNGSKRLITSFYVDKTYTTKEFERKYANRKI